MSRPPKYIALPVALAIFFVVILVFSIKQRGGMLPDNFAITVVVEIIILIALFLLLRYKHKKRNG